MKKRIVEIAVKVVVAALTAFLTAITTTSCMGHGPITLWTIGARSIRLRASFFAVLLDDMKNCRILFGGFRNNLYLCTRLIKDRT